MKTMASETYWRAVREYGTDRQKEYIDKSHLSVEGRSQSKAAELLGIDRRALDRGIQSAIDKATEHGAVLDEASGLKVLSIDIETAPMIGYLWSLWSEPRSTEFVERDWYIISYAYKWLGNDEVYGKSLRQCTRYGAYSVGTEDDRELIEDLWKLFSEADIVVAHNGDKFDIKKIKTQMLIHMMRPPTPFRTVDTLKICKREFAFTSNRLDYIAERLLGERKLDTGGFDLWKKCLHGDEDAWQHMLDYNIRDVDILERVYLRVRAWDRSHPNVAIMTDIEEPACTVCASTDLRPVDKKTATNVSLFHTYECGNCGHKMRGRKNIRSKVAMRGGLVNAR
jgi:DNA polymerase elongation subunit (family B)